MSKWHLGAVLFVLSSTAIFANPTGGSVASGLASIGSSGKTLTVNQTTPTAIIDWSTFSIASGETTKFVQPSALSAVLNRVTGGETSVIDGTLSANGQVFLINGNGILVGKSGNVSTGGFVASTQDISDSDFLAGNLHFVGSSTASVQNLGKVSPLGGSIYFIGKQVANAGTLTATGGTVGLVAGTDVLIAQKNADGSTVTVQPSAAVTATTGTGVSNSGAISAAAAELKAANGNIYALAINNTGTVRATGVSKKGGHIWLVADGGTVETSGTLATSAAGAIETSADHVDASGTVSAGQGGHWSIDPADVVISTSQPTGSNLNSKTLSTALSTGSVTIVASGGSTDSGNIDVNSPLAWTGTTSLTLVGSYNINLNSAITAPEGTLVLHSNNIVRAPGAVDVGDFNLEAGTWEQIVGPGLAKLPAFSATFFNFNGNVFMRFAGGNGGSQPYIVPDVYSLEAIGSGSALEADNYILENNVDAAPAAKWNFDGVGFAPIPTYTGVFNGNGDAITGFSTESVGLFAAIGAGGTVENLNLTGINMTSGFQGVLAGTNAGTIQNCSSSGTATLISLSAGNFGGLVGTNTGEIANCSSSVTLNVQATNGIDIGGLVASNSGSIVSCSYSGKISLTGSVAGVGGLVGANSGTIGSSSSKAAISVFGASGAANSQVGGLVGLDTGGITSSSFAGTLALGTGAQMVGGLVGEFEYGNITSCSNSGAITVAGSNAATNVGGLVGTALYFANPGQTTPSIVSCQNTGSIKVAPMAVVEFAGGLVGQNDAVLISGSGSSCTITLGLSASNVGVLVGDDIAGTIQNCTAAGSISGTTNIPSGFFQEIGGLVGGSAAPIIASTNAVKITLTASSAPDLGDGISNIGGIAGQTTASITDCSNSGAISATGQDVEGVGGIVGSGAGVYSCSNTGALALKGPGATEIGGVVGTTSGQTISAFNSGAITLGTQAIYCGGVVGNASDLCQSLSNTGAIKAGSGGQSIGGVVGSQVGSNEGFTLSNTGAVTVGANSSNVGGVYGNVAVQVFSAANSGAVTASGGTESAIGGVIGFFSGSSLQASYNTGKVSVSGTGNTDVGGLVGDQTNGTIQQTYNTGKVTVVGTGVGALVGASTATITQSYWNEQTSGLTVSVQATGVPTTVLMDTQSTYVGWDFVNVWGIAPGGTPYSLAFTAAQPIGP